MDDRGLVDVIGEVAPDLEVAVHIDDLAIRVGGECARRSLVVRSSLTPAGARRLVEETSEPRLVVADLVDSSAEETLRQAGWSFWDRRGRLRLWVPEVGVRLDVPTRSFVAGADGPDPRRPVTGAGGLSLAVAFLAHPKDLPGVRDIARMADMAPSTISRARRHLMQVALIDSDGSAVVPELFWATSDAWVVRTAPVDVPPEGDGWVLGGDAAAARWGAPALGSNARYYCTEGSTFERHRLRHSGADDSSIRVALAPTGLVTASAIDGIVHPVVAALDLSTSARGREILGDWSSIGPGAPDAEVVWR